MNNITHLETLGALSREQSMQGRDLPWLLKRWVESTPDKDFLIWAPFEGAHKTWSYAEFDQDVRRIVQGLIDQGVVKGDRVLIHMNNCPEFILSWYACAILGATAVTTNAHSVKRDISYFVDHAEIVGAITQPQYAELIHQSAADLKFIIVTHDNCGEPAAASQLDRACLAFNDLLKLAPSDMEREPEPMLDFAIQFTSGTTSRPKAVVWTHANALWGGEMSARHFGLQHQDICHAFLPLFHCNNQCYSLLSSLWVGGSYILQPRFSKSNFWKTALKYQATWSSMIPFCLKALMAEEVPEHQFRLWLAAVSIPELEGHFGVPIAGLYGMTETVSQPIVCAPEHRGPFMCVGRASPGYEISIRRDDGNPIVAGETGDLFIRGVRGVSLFKEYLKNPEATAECFDEDGWFDTGDRMRMDNNGDLFFSDRTKDMLKVGAENVAASEIEAVILESGWINEVAVVGQKHHMLDEVPVAFVSLLPNAPEPIKEKLIDFCKQNLAQFKVIHDVHVVDDFPRSTLEKIAKNKLRDRLPEITA